MISSVTSRAERGASLLIPEDWVDKGAQLQEKFCREIRKADSREVVLQRTTAYRTGYDLIKPHLQKYRAPRILEMGSGYGFALCYLRKLGLDAQGIEPGGSPGFEGWYEVAIELLEANGIANARQVLVPAFAEELPFADATFDVVYSIATLEHVRDIERCLTEARRVVRPGGVVIMCVPNYNSFWEMHYDIPWLPYLLHSKRVAKWYVRTLFRRRDWFIDEMHFTTPGNLKALSSRAEALRAMQIHLGRDFSLPIFGGLFRRAGEAYHFFRDDFAADEMRLKHKILMRASQVAVRIAEFLRVPPSSFQIVWEVPGDNSQGGENAQADENTS